MSHDIEPNAEYAIITVKLALATICGDTAADGLNELLRPEIGEGFIADYAFYNTDAPLIVTASNEPEEGELFSEAKTYLVTVHGQDQLLAFHRVESSLELDKMSQCELVAKFTGKFVVSDSFIEVIKLDAMRRHVV